jgi:hypothetical protein
MKKKILYLDIYHEERCNRKFTCTPICTPKRNVHKLLECLNQIKLEKRHKSAENIEILGLSEAKWLSSGSKESSKGMNFGRAPR